MSKDLLRLSQLVTSFGSGAMIDLPDWSVMIAGLDRWDDRKRRRIAERRLACRLPEGFLRGLATPPMYEESPYRKDAPGVDAIIFPQWFVATRGQDVEGRVRRRLVRFHELDQKSKALIESIDGKKVKLTVAPIRFIAACEHGHVQDIDWHLFVHRGRTDCRGRLFLEETGATGDVAETWIRCECDAQRPVYEALGASSRVLGPCRGERPWLGPDARKACGLPLRLLVRTASNAYFPVAVTVLSLPDETEEERLDQLLTEYAEDFSEVESLDDLKGLFKSPRIRKSFEGFSPEAILAALQRMRSRPAARLKPEEFDVLSGVGRGRCDDPHTVLVTEHLDRAEWDPQGTLPVVEHLTLIHRLRVVTAVRGFTRFDFVTPDRDGELDPELRIQDLSLDPKPYPAIEQWGEGMFLLFDRDRVAAWGEREDVRARVQCLEGAFRRWAAERGRTDARFPGGEWIALHTIAHVLLVEIAFEGGYPLAALRERVYAGDSGYGILIYAAAFDVGGTLGGLVALGLRLVELVDRARKRGSLCAGDPVCAEHDPVHHVGGHPLSGVACHGCVLLPEPCCEMPNDFLDRALAIGTLTHPGLGLLDVDKAQRIIQPRN